MQAMRGVGGHKQEAGSILLIAAAGIAVLGMVIVGQQMAYISSQRTRQHLGSTAQADNIARSGLVDGINWFRRHQPVSSTLSGSAYPDAAFQPVHSTDPYASETLDESIGLVKQYPL